jgi:hypothetical protein
MPIICSRIMISQHASVHDKLNLYQSSKVRVRPSSFESKNRAYDSIRRERDVINWVRGIDEKDALDLYTLVGQLGRKG